MAAAKQPLKVRDLSVIVLFFLCPDFGNYGFLPVKMKAERARMLGIVKVRQGAFTEGRLRQGLEG
jgi:hypothetical protein